MIPTLVLLAGTTLGFSAFIWARREPGGEGPYHVFRCGRCGQKVRYLTSKAGQASACPRCWQHLNLPATSQEGHPNEAYLEKGGALPWRAARLTAPRLAGRPS